MVELIITESGESAIAPVVKELDGEDPQVLVTAMKCIDSLKPPAQTCEGRLVVLLKHKESSVRASAAETLGRLKAKSALPSLVALIKHEESWSVIAGLAIAFREFGEDSKDALPSLMKLAKKALEEQRSGEYHGVTVPLLLRALVAIGKPAAPPVIAMLEDAKAPANSKGFAMDVLWGIADHGYGAAAAAGVPGLLRAIRNKEFDELAEEDAAKALAAVGPHAKPYAAEIDAVSDKGRPYLRILLAYAAARADPVKTKGIAKLRKFLTDKDAEVFRWVTAERLGDLGPVATEALEDLKKLAKDDPTPLVRTKAATAVRRISKE
jgi:HEAT repeat protein